MTDAYAETDVWPNPPRGRDPIEERDAEIAALRAERDEYRRQWHQEVENFERETVRAEAAEAEWEKWQDRYGNLRTAMEALADEWENRPHPEGAESVRDWVYRMHASSLGSILRAVLARSQAPQAPDEQEGRPKSADHGKGFRCHGWVGSRWHNPPYGSHIHCDEPGCTVECQPCSVGDGLHRSSPHKPAEHEACDCAPSVRPATDGGAK